MTWVLALWREPWPAKAGRPCRAVLCESAGVEGEGGSSKASGEGRALPAFLHQPQPRLCVHRPPIP